MKPLGGIRRYGHPNTWCEVYGFKMGIKEGWAGQKDGLFARKFTGEIDPKEGLHSGKCKNPRKRKMLEFMMPILSKKAPMDNSHRG